MTLVCLLALPTNAHAKGPEGVHHGNGKKSNDRHYKENDHDSHDRQAYASHPRSGFVLTFGCGYAGQGYYYGPPNSHTTTSAPTCGIMLPVIPRQESISEMMHTGAAQWTQRSNVSLRVTAITTGISMDKSGRSPGGRLPATSGIGGFVRRASSTQVCSTRWGFDRTRITKKRFTTVSMACIIYTRLPPSCGFGSPRCFC